MNNLIKQINIDYPYSLIDKSIAINKSKSGITVNINTASNILMLSDYENIKTIFEYFPALKDTLNIDSSIDFSKIIGKRKSKEYFEYLKSKIQLFEKIFDVYHLKIFPIRKSVYSNFSHVSLEGKILELPIYSHKGVTGRTSIISGFNFLTMKKTDRKLLKSSIKDNILAEIDFKSCEPFFYLKSKNLMKEEIYDVYEWIANTAGIKDVKDRDKFKRGILSLLYGASDSTIKSISGISDSNILKIKKVFEIEKFSKELEKEYSENGFIRNYYGRPIKSNNNLVNYWIQSSAVDYCSLAFKNLLEEMKEISPCFMIHDSMTVTTHKNNIDLLKSIKHLKDLNNIIIPVSVDIY